MERYPRDILFNRRWVKDKQLDFNSITHMSRGEMKLLDDGVSISTGKKHLTPDHHARHEDNEIWQAQV